MRIVCPTCATCYEVSVFSIGADGRAVRCARCRAVWQARPDDEPVGQSAGPAPGPHTADAEQPLPNEAQLAVTDPLEPLPVDPPADPLPAGEPPPDQAAAEAASDIETAAASATLADHPIDLDAGRPPLVIDDTPGPAAATGGDAAEVASLAAHRRNRHARRALPKAPSQWRLRAAIAALIAVIGALIGWRGDVVRHAPQMASLYSAIGLPVNLRKLVFADVHIARQVHDGVPMLLIEGTIVSTSPAPVEVPRLRLALRNAAGAELQNWTMLPAQTKLAPFESLPFQSRLASPPDAGHDVVVRFFNRRDAVASLR